MRADVLRLIAILRSDAPDDDAFRTSGSNSAITGTQASFETILRMFHKRIYNLTYRLLGDFDEAADLTQETFVRAYKAYPRFQGPSQAVYPWLCRIAVNGCKNKFRELSQRNRREILSLDEPVEGEDSSMSLEIGDESSNPAGIFERRDLEAKVQEAIQALPSEFRVIVVLRDMQGLSYREIADATGLTMDVVKVRLYRGRVILRRRLSPYLEE